MSTGFMGTNVGVDMGGDPFEVSPAGTTDLGRGSAVAAANIVVEAAEATAP
jgi:hypothetical protein